MTLTHKQISEGEIIPRFYGVAYRDFVQDVIICYPFPFNIIVQYWRKWWMAIRYYRKENPLEVQAIRNAAKRTSDLRDQSYLLGLSDGEQVKRHELQRARKEGYAEGWAAYDKALLEEVDKGRDRE